MERNDWLRIAGLIRENLRQYLAEYSLQALIVGISGGIDSALTAAIVSEVCKTTGIPLLGRSITIETNSKEERERAKAVGMAYCDDFREVDLTSLYRNVRDAVEEEKRTPESREDKVRRGNIKARLRMIYLYNLAQTHRGMVLSTDNRTEYMLGFWTLHGDVGDYAPLFGLWKTEVYALARALLATEEPHSCRAKALRDCIECLPTDGLGITSTDVEQLGAKDYSEVDATLIHYRQNPHLGNDSEVIRRHLASGYKRKNPYVITRDMLGLGKEIEPLC